VDATSFNPPFLLRNPHVQTLVASGWPRTWLLKRYARRFEAEAEDVILECSEGIRLHGLYNPHPRPERGLAILLHGWEGSAESSYQLSTACTLANAGYDVFRLHLRDHGPSHNLNPELFNSTRLQEVVDAVREIEQLYPNDRSFLAGHSLGGNFSLRVAAIAPEEGIKLRQVVAVCPVLSPTRTMSVLETGQSFYGKFLVRQWKRSLRSKLEHYPELGYEKNLPDLNSLAEMNEFFVPNYTDFDNPESYYAAYALTGNTLAGLQVPTQLIISQDDPIIPIDDLANVARTECLRIETPRFGGHCGFLMNWRLQGWIDRRLLELFV
jgi:hypothetical protein